MKKICILSPHQLNLVSGGKGKPSATHDLGHYSPENFSQKIGKLTITPTVSGNNSGAIGMAKFDYPLTKNLDFSAGIGLATDYHNNPKLNYKAELNYKFF